MLTPFNNIITARKRSLRRLCFYTCLSFCSWGGVCLSACWDTHPPGSRHPPGTDIPWSRHHPGSRHPQEQTPPRTDTPVQCMLGDMGNKWAVRILLECILVVLCDQDVSHAPKILRQKPKAITKGTPPKILIAFRKCVVVSKTNNAIRQITFRCKMTLGFCRAMKMKGMVFRYTWVYSKEDTMAHTCRPVVTS